MISFVNCGESPSAIKFQTVSYGQQFRLIPFILVDMVRGTDWQGQLFTLPSFCYNWPVFVFVVDLSYFVSCCKIREGIPLP